MQVMEAAVMLVDSSESVEVVNGDAVRPRKR